LPRPFYRQESALSRLSILWLAFSFPIAWSQEPASDAPSLTLPQAAALTLERNPRLRSAPFGREAAAAELDQATLRPPWSVDLQVEDIAGTGEFSGFNAAETTLRLSRIFRPSDVRSGQISIASAQGDQLENELEVERLDLMTLLARRFEAVVHRQDLLKLAEEAVAVWQGARELVLSRERAGAAPAVERLRTEIQLANARLQVEDAEHELRAARLSLAATWGDRTPTFGSADADLCRLPELAPFETVATNLERNPELLRFASEQRLEEARAQLADARRRPDWTLSAGVRRFEQFDDQALVFSVSVPLGSSARAAPAFRRANALRQQSEFEEQAVRLRIHATLFELYQEMLHARTALRTFDREILPRANEILTDIEEGYRVGRFSHLELLNAQADLLAARAARLTACSDHQLFLIDIERLTGGGSVWLADRPGATP
jgi:cobalt-zinc-cadmium efflux system outer membrane protein